MTIYSYAYGVLLSAILARLLLSLRYKDWNQIGGYALATLWVLYALYVSMQWNA